MQDRQDNQGIAATHTVSSPHLFNMHDLEGVLKNHSTFEDELALSQTSKASKANFEARWGTPKAIFFSLLASTPEKIAEVQRKLPQKKYNELKAFVNDKQNIEDHLAYIAWCMLTDNVMELDIQRMRAALAYVKKFQRVTYNKVCMELAALIDLRELTDFYVTNANVDAYVKRVEEFYEIIRTKKIIFNVSKANMYNLVAYITPDNKDYLKAAQLKRVHISPAYSLSMLIFEGKNLENANFQGAVFENVRLINANLRKANLSNAKLNSIDLKNADLTDTDLSFASIKKGPKDKEDLSEAIMLGVAIGITVVGLIALPFLLSMKSIKNRFHDAKYFETGVGRDKLKDKLDMFATVKTDFNKEFRASIKKDLIRVIKRDYESGKMSAEEAIACMEMAFKHSFFSEHRDATSRLKNRAARFFNDKYENENYKKTRSQLAFAETAKYIADKELDKKIDKAFLYASC